ncbi:MAG: nucleoside/nucleotide kinase family protein [Paracoccaceae bacterium]
MLSPESLKTSAFAALTRRIVALPKGNGRRLIAVAGAPASGKSVLARDLCAAVNRSGRPARAVPMDGFHLDNRVLDARGQLARKGAPETFDAEGFVALIRRLNEGGEVVYPLFDRERDIAIAGAAVIEADCDIAIVEGNYLLLDEDPWRALQPLWGISVWLETPHSVLLDRCVQRWLDHGHTPESARARAEGNDLANARRIATSRLPADVILSD